SQRLFALPPYALACWPTVSTRLPMASSTSIRCSPQLACTCPLNAISPPTSSMRGPAGFPFVVTSRKVAFSLFAHRAVSSPGTLTQGVSIGLAGVTQALASPVGRVTVWPVEDRYEWRAPEPPPSAAGFVQAPTIVSPGTFPNSVFAGGGTVERNDAYVTRHPVWVAEWQSGMCWKEPPTSFPRGTATVAPSRSADTSLD